MEKIGFTAADYAKRHHGAILEPNQGKNPACNNQYSLQKILKRVDLAELNPGQRQKIMANSNNSNGISRKDYIFSISIIGLFFFIFGFVTWLNGYSYLFSEQPVN